MGRIYITQEFSGDEKPSPPALTLSVQARCARAPWCLTTQVYFHVQTLWWGLALFFWSPWGIADGQMELFVNGFWSFMLDPLWSWLALKNPLRGKVTWFISLALVDQEFNCLKGHMWRIAHHQALLQMQRWMWWQWVRGLLSGRCLFHEVSCDQGAGSGQPPASALASWGWAPVVPLLVTGWVTLGPSCNLPGPALLVGTRIIKPTLHPHPHPHPCVIWRVENTV